ncbi:hypothetical protein ACNI65_09365 [Roseateles sp. So40a]|uniref:hypothetical protein n=1 Tax=Roseateles sp. So40a TaxID=3400226 RepID=UPI003A8BD037
MGSYNTTGILQKSPAVSAGKAEDANAGVKIDPSEISKLDALQMLLDLVGLIPGAGAPADILNGLISAGRGDWVGAGLSVLGAVPIAGEAATAGKIAQKSERYAAGLKKVAEEVLPHLPKRFQKPLREALEKAEAKLDELAGRPPKKKPEAEPPKAKNEGSDGAKVNPKTQKPHPDCGKVSYYRAAPKKLGELNADHVPSGAALKAAAEQYLKESGLLRKLSSKQLESVLNRVYNNAKTITVPEDVHKEGRTWGPKNNAGQVSGDSKDLKGAFRKDAAAIQKSMDTKDHGCSEKYAEAVKELEKFDFDQYVKDAVSSHRAVKPLLKK